MKRHPAIHIATAALLLLAAGCTSAGVNIDEYAPVAIVTVYGNATLPWYEGGRGTTAEEEASGGRITGKLNRTINAGNPEVQTVQGRIDGAAESLRQMLEADGIPVVEQDTVQGCPALSSKYIALDLSDDVVADGYKKLSYSGTQRNRMIAEQTGARSTLFAEFTFQKQKFPRGLTEQEVAARATLHVYVANPDGRRLIQASFTGTSTDRVPYQDGRWDRKALCDLFPQAVESAIAQFLMHYHGVPLAAEAGADGSAAQATSIALPARHDAEAPAETDEDAATADEHDDADAAATATAGGDESQDEAEAPPAEAKPARALEADSVTEEAEAVEAIAD